MTMLFVVVVHTFVGTNMLTTEQQEFVRTNIRLAWKIANRYTRFRGELQFVIYDGAIDGLIKMAERMHEFEDVKQGLISQMIIFGIRSSIKQSRAKKRNFRAAQLVSEPPSYDDPYDDALTFQEMIKSLPEKLQVVIRYRYCDGLTYDKIGTLLGVHRQTIMKRENKALSILRYRVPTYRKVEPRKGQNG